MCKICGKKKCIWSLAQCRTCQGWIKKCEIIKDLCTDCFLESSPSFEDLSIKDKCVRCNTFYKGHYFSLFPDIPVCKKCEYRENQCKTCQCSIDVKNLYYFKGECKKCFEKENKDSMQKRCSICKQLTTKKDICDECLRVSLDSFRDNLIHETRNREHIEPKQTKLLIVESEEPKKVEWSDHDFDE